MAPPLGYPVDVGSSEKTAPIDLATGRRAPFPRATRDPDAPRQGEVEHTPSELLDDAFKAAAEVGRAVERGEMPTSEQLSRLGAGIGVVKMGIETASTAFNAGGNGRGSMTMAAVIVIAGIVSAAVTFGVNSLTSNNDALATAIVGRMDANDKRVDQQDQRIDEVAEDLNAIRYVVGKTIEWFGQGQYEACVRDDAVSDGINYIARQLPKSKDGDFAPIVVECEQYPLLPTEMADLQTYTRRVDNAR